MATVSRSAAQPRAGPCHWAGRAAGGSACVCTRVLALQAAGSRCRALHGGLRHAAAPGGQAPSTARRSADMAAGMDCAARTSAVPATAASRSTITCAACPTGSVSSARRVPHQQKSSGGDLGTRSTSAAHTGQRSIISCATSVGHVLFRCTRSQTEGKGLYKRSPAVPGAADSGWECH